MHPSTGERSTSVTASPVPDGPVALRSAIRRQGPVAAPALAVLIYGVSAVLRVGEPGRLRGAAAYLTTLLAAPGLLVTGTPVAGGAARAVGGYALSVLLWWGVGTVAARRATRSPVAAWDDWWRELAWYAGAVWAGTLAALGVTALVLLL